MAVSSKHTRRYRRPMRVQRVPTGMGQIFRLLRFLHLTRIGRYLFRKPRHVADLYVNGQFVRPISIVWTGNIHRA